MNAVDTNVLIYAADARDTAKQRQAQQLLKGLSDGVLLWQVACEFIAASRKLGQYGFTAEAAWQQLRILQRLFPLVPPSPLTFEHARRLHLGEQVSFWDAMIIGACLDAGVARLYSEDLPGRHIDGVEILNPSHAEITRSLSLRHR